METDKVHKPSTSLTNPAEANRVDVDKPEKPSKGIIDQTKADGVDELDTGLANLANSTKTNWADKLDIGIVGLAEVTEADKPDTDTVAENLQRQSAEREAIMQTSFFFFYRVACLFLSSLELKISDSLAISWTLSSIITSVKWDTPSSK